MTSLAELQQKDTWVPSGDPISAELLKSFDISPTPLYITDVLAALQTGLVDAVTVPPLVALALQWQQPCRLHGRSAAHVYVLDADARSQSVRVNQ
ncbi:MAG: TRAP transporter substrate-binding protein DctP [Gammaproteobacteria bacterium]|nr:TRAP transporter substrate-binding protein DctP [Gammaproteobacteria bacterium]